MCGDIGIVFLKLEEYHDALEYYKKALAIRKRVLGDSHIDTVRSYEYVALAYYILGEYQRSLEYSEKALEIRMEIDGGDQESIALVYDLIGEIID